MKPENIHLLWILEGGVNHAPTRHRALVYDRVLRKSIASNRYVCWRYSYADTRRRFRDALRKAGSDGLARVVSSVLAELGRLAFPFVRFIQILLVFPRANKLIYLRHFPTRLERILIAAKRSDLYFDFDDALYLSRPSKQQEELASEGEGNQAMAGRMADFIRKCRAVIVSNAYLATWARQFNNRVAEIPTSVEIKPALLRPDPSPGSFVLGWIGAPENQRYLLAVWGGVKAVLDRHPIAVLHIITSKPWTYPHERVKIIPWNLATFEQEIRKFTVGLAPLSDNPWTRGKMQFKAVQYAAQGVPVVGSRVGFNLNHWKDGENLLFAETEEEVAHAIERLLADTSLQERIRQAGLATVKQYYSPEVNAAKLTALLSD